MNALLSRQTLLKEFSLDNPGERVAGMGNRGGELFSKSCYYFTVVDEGFGIIGDELIGRGFSTFVIDRFDHAPRRE